MHAVHQTRSNIIHRRMTKCALSIERKVTWPDSSVAHWNIATSKALYQVSLAQASLGLYPNKTSIVASKHWCIWVTAVSRLPTSNVAHLVVVYLPSQVLVAQPAVHLLLQELSFCLPIWHRQSAYPGWICPNPSCRRSCPLE